MLHSLAAARTNLDATALAEAIWLAAAFRQETGPRQTEPDEHAHLQPRDDSAHNSRLQDGRTAPDSLRPGAALHEKLADSPGSVPGQQIAVTRGRALPQSLDLLRALRPYKRPWTAGLRTELDIERTIDAYARSGELIPAFRAAPERWFDLLLIVDRSLSMQVWKDTISELERVLDHLGAFRLLRTWGLTFEDAQPLLHDHQGAVAGPDHVLSPQGRRLVLIVSDCSHSGWHRQEIWQQLRTWAQSTPVALLDPLPPKLWRRSALDLPGVTATQAVPGNSSTTLRFDVPLLLDNLQGGPSPWLPVPVLSLSPHSLGRWAGAQMRADPNGCDSVLIPPTGRLPRGRPPSRRAAQADPAQAFIRTASPETVRLAVLCALVGRISLPVLQLIRQELVPQATVADVAELITSDIVALHPQGTGTFVVTFRNGVEEELKQLLPQHDAWRLCGMLEEYVTARLDSTANMPTVLHHPDALQLLPAEVRPFGQAAHDVLRALGIINGEPEPSGMARILASATARIASGLDIGEICHALFDTTIPDFADTLLLYLCDPLPIGDGPPIGPLMLRRWRRGGSYTDEPQVGLMESQVSPDGMLAEVLRGVRPVFTGTPVAQGALPELLGEHAVSAGQHGILAPLRGRRRVIGTALFLRRPERIAFEDDDLLVAAQLATHSALSIDKALLYSRDASLVSELQRTMLPQTMPQPHGAQLAFRYRPAIQTARAGGDWYDAIPLPGNRVALVIGDVMGHSVTSAAIMGQLRTTLQTLAGLDLSPQDVLHHLDEQAQRLGAGRMATCLYAVYDPVTHRLTVTNAGHLPPVLLHPNGRAEVLNVPPGAPIGVGEVDFEAVELDAPPGATLLLYTDGLVESRQRDVWTGIEQLRERLSVAAHLSALDDLPPLEALCDDVLDMLEVEDQDDDIALLAARFDGIAPSDVAYWFLETADTSPSKARQMIRNTLARWGLDELRDPVELLVTEVVTNAVRHSSRPVTLRLLRTDEVLRCEVGDDSSQMPRLRQPRDSETEGLGLYLVNRLAKRWGSTRLSTGKVVWFECLLPEPSLAERIADARVHETTDDPDEWWVVGQPEEP
ncbi:SAV_2336 N-terminal domain-related protein [Streptomyces althioticus]|uniref:SAV_2336 N-terminal domain-related protein n=1 Tax=Streptomyces althioticus TaxID=83380 RepID=UPI0037A348D6